MIYFCIPVHNEERTAGVVLWKLRQVMAELNRDYQIIVVDDASSDATATVLSPYIRVLPLTVIRNAQQRGYAASLELAIREAVRRAPYPKRDAIITLQADFTEDPDVIPALVKKIEAGSDVVATTVDIESDLPRSYRWGRKFLQWLLRGRDWVVGDPLSGIRAYRIITMKRALEARGGNRLLSWHGWGANAELLSQTVPQARRTDTVETVLQSHRHQRPSRFSFMEAMREVRGAASGRINSKAVPLPTDSVVATPLPITLPVREPERGRGRPNARGPMRGQRGRTQSQGRGPGRGSKTAATTGGNGTRERGKRGGAGRKRGARTEAEAPNALLEAVDTTTASNAADAPAQPSKRKRRRPRRRKEKRTTEGAQAETQQNDAVGIQQEVMPAEAAGEGVQEAVAKKKSRRGRRGGRGRGRARKNRMAEATGENTSEDTIESAAPQSMQGSNEDRAVEDRAFDDS